MLAGHLPLSRYMHEGLMDEGFDLAVSHELKIDHSIICPIITVRPDADLPVVPIYTNVFVPPLASPKRFWRLGRAIRKMIDTWPSDLRVAAIGTGHLSLELGGPRQFGETGPDPEFDRNAVQWISSGDIDSIFENVTLASMAKSGNATHGFLNMILMMGIAGQVSADYVDTVDLYHTMEAYFTWYPEGKKPDVKLATKALEVL